MSNGGWAKAHLAPCPPAKPRLDRRGLAVELRPRLNPAKRTAMNSVPGPFSAVVAIGLLCTSAHPSHAQTPATAPASFTVISPVFGQLVRFSMPSTFIAASENTQDAFYIREAVPKGETVDTWTQMITITGSRGMAGIADFTPQKLTASIALGFKKACPESLKIKDLGATKFGERDAYMAVASCGKVDSSADGHSETALIVAVGGATDAYTIQWAERKPPASSAPDIDEATWRGRLRELMPIRLCAIVPGEAAPYPSCLQQK